MATYTWTTATTGSANWSVPTDWNPTAPTSGPGSTTSTDLTAVVIAGGTKNTATFNQSGWYIGSLTVQSGSMAFGAGHDLTANGAVSVSGSASLNVNAATGGDTLTALAGLTTAGASALAISAGTSGSSTLSVTGGTSIGASGGAQQVSTGGTLSTDTLTITAGNLKETGGQISVTSGSSSAVFLNGGSLSLSGGSFSDSGGLSIASGILTLGTTSAGLTFDATAGGISLTGGSITDTGSGKNILKGAITGSGGGGTIASAGTGTLDVTGAITGAVTTLQAASGSTLELDGAIASGNTVTLGGTTSTLALGAPGSFSGTVAGLSADTTANQHTTTSVIDLQGIGAITALGIASGSTLEVTTASTTYNIKTTGGFTSDYINFTSDGSGGQVIWVDTQVCYTAGTRILTDRGEIAVEDIAAGDLVVTLDGDTQALKPVKWVGHRRLDLTTHRKPESAAPIRIVRDAFADNQPHRDLVVSPDHGILIDGQLVPAKLLINGTTITQDRSVKTVTYHHVELDRHAILLAEGLPAESYLDTGNRAFFANAGLALVLHPEFEVNANLKCWENDSCAPLAVTPDVVGPIWHRLSERAAALGYVAPNVARTGDANVHLLADGRELRPVNIDRDRFVFMLPAGVQDLRLVSRASAPRDVVAYHDDPRQLGVLVSRISIRAGDVVHDVPLDHPALSEGWHPVERANGRTWRWTSGAGALPISMSTNPLIIEMKLHQRDTYLLAGIDVPTRIAA